MKTGLGSQAYTIVEVMIVLAVSALLLVGALRLIGGQSQKTQFSQAINDIRTQMNDIINNVSTGYYANTNNFSCSPVLGGGPNIILAASNNQGANGGCVYIGRAVQFNPGGNLKQFTMYNLVGLQFKGGGYSGSIPASLSEAMPVAIAPSSNAAHLAVPPGQIKLQMSYGLQVVAMHYVDIVSKVSGTTATLAFISNFGQYDGSGNLTSGSKVASLWAINPSSISAAATSPVMVDSLDDASKYVQADSVSVCFLGGTNQYGVMTIGSNGRQLNTKMDVYGSVAAAGGLCS